MPSVKQRNEAFLMAKRFSTIKGERAMIDEGK
jgi:hypothetical protein